MPHARGTVRGVGPGTCCGLKRGLHCTALSRPTVHVLGRGCVAVGALHVRWNAGDLTVSPRGWGAGGLAAGWPFVGSKAAEGGGGGRGLKLQPPQRGPPTAQSPAEGPKENLQTKRVECPAKRRLGGGWCPCTRRCWSRGGAPTGWRTQRQLTHVLWRAHAARGARFAARFPSRDDQKFRRSRGEPRAPEMQRGPRGGGYAGTLLGPRASALESAPAVRGCSGLLSLWQ